MSKLPEQPQDLHELAFLPAGDPARQTFETRIPTMAPAEQAYWLGVLKETDRIHSELEQTPLPRGIEQKLLRIPDVHPPGRSRWKNLLEPKLSWKHVAACLLIAFAVFNYVRQPHGPRQFHPLDDQSAVRIATIAVQNHQTIDHLDIASNDVSKVQQALLSDSFSFPPMVLQPSSALTLLGGGKTSFNGLPVAFTRWKDTTGTYTLYQFDGTKLGLPTDFQRTLGTPAALWHGNLHYRVPIWPGTGGQCAWALVLETDNAKDAFSTYQY